MPRPLMGSPVHVAPACAGSDRFGSYAKTIAGKY
jgi:hypothetical protein